MNEALTKAAGDYLPQILAGGSIALFCALLIGLVVGIRMRKQILTQAAEGLLATPEFAAAAKVEADKAIRSVPFQEAVQRTIRDDVRTQSGIIDIVLTSAEIREMIDGRVKHGKANHDYEIDARIRASQEATRQEVIRIGDRMEEKLDHVVKLLMDHIQATAGKP